MRQNEEKKAGISGNAGIASKEAEFDKNAAQALRKTMFSESVGSDSRTNLEQTRLNMLRDLQEVQKQLQAALEADEDFKSITGWAPETGWDASSTLKARKLGFAMKKLSKEMGVEIRKTGHDRWNTVNTYHRSVMEEFLKRTRNVG